MTRDTLIEALSRHHRATQIADEHEVSVSAVCRALHREGLETDGQPKRRRARERYAELLADAERDGTAEPNTLDWLRAPVRPLGPDQRDRSAI